MLDHYNIDVIDGQSAKTPTAMLHMAVVQGFNVTHIFSFKLTLTVNHGMSVTTPSMLS